MNLSMKKDPFQVQAEIDKKLEDIAKRCDIKNPYIAMNPYGLSPLTALVCFSRTYSGRVTLTVNGTSFNLEKQDFYVFPIIGLHAGEKNHLTIQIDGSSCFEKEWEIAELSHQIAKLEGNWTDKTDEWLFLLPIDEYHLPAAYDRDGRCRWFFNRSLHHCFKLLNNGHILTSGSVSLTPPFGVTDLVEMDLLGRYYRRWILPQGFCNDAIILDNGELIVVTNSCKNGTVMDQILWIDASGEHILHRFKMRDYIKQDFSAKLKNGSDWLHISSLRCDKRQKVLWVSFSFFPALLKIDLTLAEVVSVWLQRSEDSIYLQEKDISVVAAPIGIENSAVIQNTDKMVIGHKKQYGGEIYLLVWNGIDRDPEKVVSSGLYSELLWQLYDFEDGYLLHAGSCTNAPHSKIGFALADKSNIKNWSEGIFYSRSLIKNGKYRFEALSQVALKLCLKNISLRGKVIGTIGHWQEALEIDVMLPIEEIDDDCSSLDLTFACDDQRLIFQGKFFQGEAVALILYQGDVVKQYYINNNRWPFGAIWLKSEADALERFIRWALPVKELQGVWNIQLWIDGVLFDPSVQLICRNTGTEYMEDL